MSQRIARYIITVFAILGGLFLLSRMSLYVVDQRQQAVVLRFGEPVIARTEPGVYFKIPLVDRVRLLPTTLQFWGDDRREVLSDLPTQDNKKIELIPWAVWKVNDPITFVRRMRTMENAENRVSQFARGAIRDVITQYDLEDLVRSTSRDMQIAQLDFDESDWEVLQETAPDAEIQQQPRDEIVGRGNILERINQQSQRSLASEAEGARGIALVEIGLTQIDFVDTVRRTTFERWIAEREAISTRNVAEGERAKQEIINKTKAEVEQIQGMGEKRANQIRGTADGTIIRSYAEAIGEVGEFYTFVRTLEAYQAAMSEKTEMIFTTDNEFLRQLQRLDAAELLDSNYQATSSD